MTLCSQSSFQFHLPLPGLVICSLEKPQQNKKNMYFPKTMIPVTMSTFSASIESPGFSPNNERISVNKMLEQPSGRDNGEDRERTCCISNKLIIPKFHLYSDNQTDKLFKFYPAGFFFCSFLVVRFQNKPLTLNATPVRAVLIFRTAKLS